MSGAAVYPENVMDDRKHATHTRDGDPWRKPRHRERAERKSNSRKPKLKEGVPFNEPMKRDESDGY